MKSVCGILIYLCAFTVLCLAVPLKENEAQREKRQMKATNGTPGAVEQAELKFLGAPVMAATGPLQAVTSAANNLPTGRFAQGLMLQGGYGGNLPGYGYGGFGGNVPITPLTGNVINPGVNQQFGANQQLGATLTGYPSGLDLYQNYMFGQGFYPQVGSQIQQGIGSVGGLPSSLEGMFNMQGLNTQLIAQPSQIQQQIVPYPSIPGIYPQLGYGAEFQNFQG